jgi:hypothetical protein
MSAGAERPLVRVLAELLFSANTGLAAISLLFCASFSAELPFIHLEVYLNQALGIRQTDYIRGYFTIWIPSLITAVCIWSLLRLLSRLPFTKSFLCSIAGLIILLSPTAMVTCGYERNRWSLEWPYKTVWGEAMLAIICFFLFLKWPSWTSWRIWMLAFLGHCIFWYWFMNGGFNPLNWEISGYAGPAAMVLGFCALLIWSVYLLQVKVERRPVEQL